KNCLQGCLVFPRAKTAPPSPIAGWFHCQARGMGSLSLQCRRIRTDAHRANRRSTRKLGTGEHLVGLSLLFSCQLCAQRTRDVVISKESIAYGIPTVWL